MSSLLSSIRYSKTPRIIAVFASGNLLAMLLGVVGSLVQARYIGPEELGVFRTFGIVAGYLTFLHLGVFDGLQREIPIQLGRGNRPQAEQAASASLAWIILVSLVCTTFFLALALQAACYREWMQFWGWIAHLPIAVGTFYGGYLTTTFRTGQQFIKLSKTSIIQAVIGTLILPLLAIMGYYGACLRTALTSITSLLFLHHWCPLRVRPRLDWSSLWQVLRIGMPLSGIGYIYTSLWVSVEGTLVLSWYGTQALGLYSVAVLIRTVCAQLVQNVSQVLNVKICERYGSSNNAAASMGLIIRPVILVSVASLPIIGVGWLVLPSVVWILLPRYAEATFLMQIFLVIMPVAIIRIPTSVLWVALRLADCFISVIIGFAVFVVMAYGSYRFGFGVPGVAVAFIAGQAIYAFAAWIFTLRLISRERQAIVCLDGSMLRRRK